MSYNHKPKDIYLCLFMIKYLILKFIHMYLGPVISVCTRKNSYGCYYLSSDLD